ncbi:hypothetical protein C8J57DRAFT_1717982 [Mycena rebaudengoi]|nr:hypothetical protein C8J57DRAFT_1717982 [Mycena rebaudengoi]
MDIPALPTFLRRPFSSLPLPSVPPIHPSLLAHHTHTALFLHLALLLFPSSITRRLRKSRRATCGATGTSWAASRQLLQSLPLSAYPFFVPPPLPFHFPPPLLYPLAFLPYPSFPSLLAYSVCRPSLAPLAAHLPDLAAFVGRACPLAHLSFILFVLVGLIVSRTRLFRPLLSLRYARVLDLTRQALVPSSLFHPSCLPPSPLLPPSFRPVLFVGAPRTTHTSFAFPPGRVGCLMWAAGYARGGLSAFGLAAAPRTFVAPCPGTRLWHCAADGVLAGTTVMAALGLDFLGTVASLVLAMLQHVRQPLRKCQRLLAFFPSCLIVLPRAPLSDSILLLFHILFRLSPLPPSHSIRSTLALPSSLSSSTLPLFAPPLPSSSSPLLLALVLSSSPPSSFRGPILSPPQPPNLLNLLNLPSPLPSLRFVLRRARVSFRATPAVRSGALIPRPLGFASSFLLPSFLPALTSNPSSYSFSRHLVSLLTVDGSPSRGHVTRRERRRASSFRFCLLLPLLPASRHSPIVSFFTSSSRPQMAGRRGGTSRKRIKRAMDSTSACVKGSHREDERAGFFLDIEPADVLACTLVGGGGDVGPRCAGSYWAEDADGLPDHPRLVYDARECRLGTTMRVPQEIVDVIIDNFAMSDDEKIFLLANYWREPDDTDSESLRACSLTSRSFLRRGRIASFFY